MSSKTESRDAVSAALKVAHGGEIKNVSAFDGETWESTYKVIDDFSDVHGIRHLIAGFIGIDRSTLGKRYSQRAISDYGRGRKPQVPKFFQETITSRLELSASLWRCEPRAQGLAKINKATIEAGFGPVSMKVARTMAASAGMRIKKGEATGWQKSLGMAREKIKRWFDNMKLAGVDGLPPSAIFNMDEHDLNARAKKFTAVSQA